MKKILLIGCLLTLSACGFQLRGDYQFAFATLALEAPAGVPVALELRRQLGQLSNLKLVDIGQSPAVRLRILENANEKRILSLSAGGRVREFQLEQRLRFDLLDAKGENLLPPDFIIVTRDFTFNDTQALAKEGEERMLLIDMQADLINQLLRRLNSARASTNPNANPRVGS
jgi:LPS-assembly lipoprotein